MKNTDLSIFLDDLRADAVEVGAEYHLTFTEASTHPMPVRLLARPSGSLKGRPLFVAFHGAVDQTKRGFPVYEGGFALKPPAHTDAVLLAVADPSLWLSKELTAAWYAPNRYLDVPQALYRLFASICDVLAPRRLIFTGGSTGAHPALVQSAHFPGCVCMVVNPIVWISGYNPDHVDRYLSICWHRDQELRKLPAGFTDDSAALYNEGHDHSLIVLQNATDHHFGRQAVRLAANIRNHRKFLFLSSFFPNSIGHTFPGRVRAQWMTAAALSPTAACHDIARTHAERFSPTPDTPSKTTSLSSRDLDFSARIAAMAKV